MRFTDPKPSSWQDDACRFSAQQAQAGAEDLFAATSAFPQKTTKPEAYVDALFGQDLPVRMAWVDKESPNPEEESKGKSKGGPSASM